MVNGSGGGAGGRVPSGVSFAGTGGDSHLGGGGRGTAAAGADVGGNNGSGYGGGGGGAVSGTSANPAVNGGDGADGVVIVTTYFSEASYKRSEERRVGKGCGRTVSSRGRQKQ